jgi:transposase
MTAERTHGDDTTVPVLAGGIVVTSRSWVFVSDGRPLAEPEPPTATIDYSPVALTNTNARG